MGPQLRGQAPRREEPPAHQRRLRANQIRSLHFCYLCSGPHPSIQRPDSDVCAGEEEGALQHEAVGEGQVGAAGGRGLHIGLFSGGTRLGVSQAGAPSALRAQCCSPGPAVQAAGLEGVSPLERHSIVRPQDLTSMMSLRNGQLATSRKLRSPLPGVWAAPAHPGRTQEGRVPRVLQPWPPASPAQHVSTRETAYLGEVEQHSGRLQSSCGQPPPPARPAGQGSAQQVLGLGGVLCGREQQRESAGCARSAIGADAE